MYKIAQNERNGSLIDESETVSDDAFEKFRTELMAFYAKTFSRKAIADKVEEMTQKHQNTFGERADFWYLLAMGVEIANPQSYGRGVNSPLEAAKKCEGSEKFYPTYCSLLHGELARRYHADNVNMSAELRSKYWIPLLRLEREIDSHAHPILTVT